MQQPSSGHYSLDGYGSFVNESRFQQEQVNVVSRCPSGGCLGLYSLQLRLQVGQTSCEICYCFPPSSSLIGSAEQTDLRDSRNIPEGSPSLDTIRSTVHVPLSVAAATVWGPVGLLRVVGLLFAGRHFPEVHHSTTHHFTLLLRGHFD